MFSMRFRCFGVFITVCPCTTAALLLQGQSRIGGNGNVEEPGDQQTSSVNFVGRPSLSDAVRPRSRGGMSNYTAKAASDLWEGLEIFSEADEVDERMLVHNELGDRNLQQDVQFLGPFDCGNNLMIELSHSSFSNMQQVAHVWTHLPITSKSVQILREIDLSNVNAVVMVRSPFSLFESWTKAPYNLEKCKDLVSPCEMGCDTGERHGERFRYSGEGICPFRFDGQVGAYNTYMEGYMKKIRSAGFRSVTVVPYEDLVIHTDRELERVANATGLRFTKNVQNIIIPEQAAKSHGYAHGKTVAIDRIVHRRYMKHYKPNGLKHVCKSVQRGFAEEIEIYRKELLETCDHK